MFGAGLASSGTAVAGDDWEGPIDSWTAFTSEGRWGPCRATGQIGVNWGAYKAYKCESDGWFTVYLYVKYYP
jgi:hypothetical protein